MIRCRPISQRVIVKIRRLEPDARAEPQHLIAAHFIFQFAFAIGKHIQSITLIGARKKHFAQRGVARAELRLRHHEYVPDQRAWDEQAGSADQHELADFFRMTHRKLGGDPAADASCRSDRTASDFERIEDFEIVKNHVFDGVDVSVLVGARAAGVRRRDHARALRKCFVKRQPACLSPSGHRRSRADRAAAPRRRFRTLNLTTANVDDRAAQWIASADCSKLIRRIFRRELFQGGMAQRRRDLFARTASCFYARE